MRTGGTGAVIEVLLGLTVSVTAALAALAWRHPPRTPSRAEEDQRKDEGHTDEPPE
jgi:hypothetical protein